MKKGTTNNPNGRKKGVPNKSTTLAREALARFVDNNTDKLEEWLVQIAAENPKDAFDCVIKVMEYHIPKLARTEVTGEDGEPVQQNITVEFIAPKSCEDEAKS